MESLRVRCAEASRAVSAPPNGRTGPRASGAFRPLVRASGRAAGAALSIVSRKIPRTASARFIESSVRGSAIGAGDHDRAHRAHHGGVPTLLSRRAGRAQLLAMLDRDPVLIGELEIDVVLVVESIDLERAAPLWRARV